MRPEVQTLSRQERRYLTVIVIFFVGLFLTGWSPAEARTPEIDFSITKRMIYQGPGPSFGDGIGFTVTGTLSPSVAGIGELMVRLTDTLPAGLTLGGYMGPPQWDCMVISDTQKAVAGNVVQNQVACFGYENVPVTLTKQFPLHISTTVGTHENVVLKQTAMIAGSADGVEIDDPPGNNQQSIEFEVNPRLPVPTLGEWGMVLFMILLGVAMIRGIRKKRFG